jgi:hypothetical protein
MSHVVETVNAMSHEEKVTWCTTVLTAGILFGYLGTILERAQTEPLVDVAYVGPMLVSIGAGIVGAILIAIALAVLWPKEADAVDQRDREIGRFGEHVGRAFVIVGAVTALVLALIEARHFWIANALFVGFTLAAMLEGVAKIVAYRRGFQSW